MKIKVLSYFGIVILIILLLFSINHKINNKNNNKFSEKLEYIKSIDEIDESLPTVIFFKGLISENESLDMEIMLKDLKDEINFNLLHVSLDDITNDEAKQLINEYEIKEVPILIVRNKSGVDIEKYNHISSKELKEVINKLN